MTPNLICFFFYNGLFVITNLLMVAIVGVLICDICRASCFDMVGSCISNVDQNFSTRLLWKVIRMTAMPPMSSRLVPVEKTKRTYCLCMGLYLGFPDAVDYRNKCRRCFEGFWF